MTRISVCQPLVSDHIEALPSCEKLNQLPRLDLLICACGFETRVRTIPSQYLDQCRSKKSPDVSRILVAEYETNKDDNAVNEDVFNDLASAIDVKLESFRAEKPSEIKNTVVASIQRVVAESPDHHPVVGVDISGASSNLIASLIAAVTGQEISVELIVLYTEAADYAPTEEEYNNNHDELIAELTGVGEENSTIEYGISDVANNELFTGFHKTSKPPYVVILPGYRSERFIRCLSKTNEQIFVTPKEGIYWLLGKPPHASNAWRTELSREVATAAIRDIVEESIDFTIDDANSSECCTLDYKEICSELIRLADDNMDRNLSILNFGSKMQALGCALAMIARPEFALTTARPVAFNPDQYSDEIRDSWILNFGLVSKLVHHLKCTGALEVESVTA